MTRAARPLLVMEADTEEEGEERFTPLHNHFVINKTWTLADFHEHLMRLEEADGDTSQVLQSKIYVASFSFEAFSHSDCFYFT